jgi:hypothetical protein
MSVEMEVINVGNLPNDGEGDPLRVAFIKINNNFARLSSTSWNITEAVTVGNTANQVIFTAPANAFTQGTFIVKSYNPTNNDFQNITLSVITNNDNSNLKWTGYGTTFNGNSLTRYNCTVATGNVNILVSPIPNVVLNHFINYQITDVNDLGAGMLLIAEGVEFEPIITTESGVGVTTES